MADTHKIQPLAPIVPMVYAYTTPEIARHDGWTKIGYTEKKTPLERIKEQTHTADVETKLEWVDNAIYKDGSGEAFTDKDFHRFLKQHKNVKQEEGKEPDGGTSNTHCSRRRASPSHRLHRCAATSCADSLTLTTSADGTDSTSSRKDSPITPAKPPTSTGAASNAHDGPDTSARTSMRCDAHRQRYWLRAESIPRPCRHVLDMRA